MIGTWDYAQNHYFKTISIDNKTCTLVADPSQNEGIVSEGQAYWMRIAAAMPKVDPKRAAIYQNRFNALLNGYLAMAQLAKSVDSNNDLAAWAAKIVRGKLVLNEEKEKPAYSASDADLDSIMALIQAQKNVTQAIWTDRNYGMIIHRFLPAIKNLFEERGHVYIMKPSDDWNDFTFIDYHAPETCFEIAEFCAANNIPEAADFWKKAGLGSYQVLLESIKDAGDIPAQADIITETVNADNIKVIEKKRQSWDGIRGPWRLAAALKYIQPSPEQKNVFIAYLNNWEKGFTVSALDAAMYLPLAVALGQNELASAMLKQLNQNFSSATVYGQPQHYYETTLIQLSLLGLI